MWRQRLFNRAPGQPFTQHGQRVFVIDHLVQAGAEEVGGVGLWKSPGNSIPKQRYLRDSVRREAGVSLQYLKLAKKPLPVNSWPSVL